MNSNNVIFPWNDNFETGISVIDEQHKKLVDLLNRLANHLACRLDTDELARVFDELADYTVYHFRTEEAIWRAYLSADEMSAAHEKTHQDFVYELLKLKDEHKTQIDDRIVDEIVSFLTHWLAFHILESDKHMAKIVLALKQGMPLAAAKENASMEMSGAMRVLIETVLSMYDSLSSRTLQLMREIAERQRVEARLRLSRSVIDSTLEAIFITDAEGLIVDINPSFCLEVQCAHEQIIGKDIRKIKPGLFNHESVDDIWSAAKENGHWAGETLGHDADGKSEEAWLALSAVKDDKEVITHYVGVLSSVSLLIQRQRGLEAAANHDALTGLPNRRLFYDRLNQAVMRSRRTGLNLTVCYLDLDGFKQINDTMGHAAGDQVLCSVAGSLSNLLRGEDTVARLGGDEFVLLLGDLDKEADAGLLLNRLLQDVQQPISINGASVLVTASIGVAFHPRNEGTPEQFLKYADEAMYIAKKNGKSRYHFFGQ